MIPKRIIIALTVALTSAITALALPSGNEENASRQAGAAEIIAAAAVSAAVAALTSGGSIGNAVTSGTDDAKQILVAK